MVTDIFITKKALNQRHRLLRTPHRAFQRVGLGTSDVIAVDQQAGGAGEEGENRN